MLAPSPLSHQPSQPPTHLGCQLGRLPVSHPRVVQACTGERQQAGAGRGGPLRGRAGRQAGGEGPAVRRRGGQAGGPELRARAAEHTRGQQQVRVWLRRHIVHRAVAAHVCVRGLRQEQGSAAPAGVEAVSAAGSRHAAAAAAASAADPGAAAASVPLLCPSLAKCRPSPELMP